MARQKYIGISIYTRDTDGYNGDDGAIANMIMTRDKPLYKVWADARLIAAAPEMVEVIEVLAFHLNRVIDDPEDFRVPDLEKAYALLKRIAGEEEPE